jgi:DNA-binding response OmpR family regulator
MSAALRRILLIDDTPEIAELLTFALRDLGYEISATGFTPAVNDLISAQKSDAIVLDCTAYDMSEALFDAMRAHTDHTEFPVVIITDTPEVADVSLRSRKARKVLLVSKPFTASQVANALNQLLRS